MSGDSCELCHTIDERVRLVATSEHAFCVVNREFVVDGHVMILPKAHCTSLDQLSGEQSADLLSLTERVTAMVRRAYGRDPVVVMNTGEHRSQGHLHLHVVPSRGGCRDLFERAEGAPFRPRRSVAELGRVRATLRARDPSDPIDRPTDRWA